MVALPCSICEAKFDNAKDLGTHILQQHCKDVPSTTSTEPLPECKKEPVEIQTEKSIVMDVDPLVLDKTPKVEENPVVVPQVASTPKEMDESLDDTILPVLPRPATMEETKQRFLMYNLPTDPPNFMRYVCLLCSKLYTSRYNIRMHLNTHSGRNVHTCPYCSIQFISRQSYESHIKSHTEEDDSIISETEQHKTGLQIVSVKSIPNFEQGNSSSIEEEEIQIEPDLVIDEQTEVKAVHNTLPMTAPTKPSLVIRPLSQMQVAFESQQAPLKGPPISYNCSFCNTKHGSQDLLLTHLSQHLNFHGAKPSAQDLEKGFMNFNVPSQIQKGVMKTKHMCLSCGKLFGKEAQVKIHLNVHYGDNIYNCRFCEKVFASYQAFEEHVKSHSEEYKFNCKFCHTSFINRNVMVTHQRSCSFNTESTPEGDNPDQGSNSSSPPEKKIKLVLNGDDLKDFIKAKDEEMSQKQSKTTLTIVPVLNNNEATDDNGVVKQVVRKRAPIFPFEPEDHYIPDNNSNNIIPKEEIVPPPTAIEKKQGYCLRPFRETGQQRYICTVCGKHYTTMYNMRQHRNIHTGSGLHCCRYCGRSFTHKHVWETHERIHTGERPFRCPTCPKDFADRSNYNSHRKLCALSLKQKTPNSPTITTVSSLQF